MNLSRRGLLGLFGKAAVAAPFAATALVLREDKATGLLIPPGKIPLVELPPDAPQDSDVYLNIPVRALRAFSIDFHAQCINVMGMDSAAMDYARGLPWMTCDLSFNCTNELAQDIHRKFQASFGQ